MSWSSGTVLVATSYRDLTSRIRSLELAWAVRCRGSSRDYEVIACEHVRWIYKVGNVVGYG